MKLYSYYRSSASYRVRIALNLKDISHDIIPVDLVKKEQKAEGFLSMNPQGLVPTLQDGDKTFTQSLAILEYLEEHYPHTPRLLPPIPALRAKIRAFALAIACDIHPLNNVRVLNYLKEELHCDDAAKNTWYQYWVQQGLAALEQTLTTEHTPYCFGNEPSLADVCLIPQLYNARRFECDMSVYPRLVAIETHCLKLHAFKKASPEQQVDYPRN